MADEAQRKRSFFEMLYPSEDEDDQGREDDAESVRTWLENSTIAVPRAPDLVRSASAPISSTGSSTVIKERPILLRRQRFKASHKGTPLANEVGFAEETPSIARSMGPMRAISKPAAAKKQTASAAGNNSMLGTRKRDSLVMVPENRRIFTGCCFYYFPNNDIATARKARIRKAQEYGATWTPDFNTEVTHIIVDTGLTYNEVAKFVTLPPPSKGTIVVNENYPLDCIQHYCMLDHTKKTYLVPGYPQAFDAEKPAPESNATEHSDKSLQLKPGRWDTVQQSAITTTPRDESAQTSHPVSGSPIPQSHAQQHPENVSAFKEGSISVKQQDVLDEIISETKKLEHFLDDDEDEASAAISGNDDSDNGHSSPERKPKAPRKKKSSVNVPWQENFSCMKGGNDDSSSENPNSNTIEILQQMADYYERMRDNWRPLAYRKVITTLKRQASKISTYEEAFALPFVGQRLAEKIEEIVRTNRLRRLDSTKLEPTDLVLQKFMNIYGVAHAHASKWIAQGYSTFSDLLEKAPLTANQRLGIEKYDDFSQRIPRDEVTALGEVVKEAARTIDPAVNVIIGGSHRRGAKDSGDIDLIITRPDVSIVDLNPCFDKLISVLTAKKFLVAALAVSGSESGSKWHGCCVLPGQEPQIWRRIDFLLVADCELGAALIYFTGNDIFNRSIRLLASKKGMRLNQRGLYKDVMRGPGRVKLNEGDLVEGKDERKIFEILGVPWRRPEDRVC